MGKRRTKPLTPRQKLEALAQAALDKKAERVLSLHVKEASGYTDYFLICSGSHPKQNQAIAQAMADCLLELGQPALGIEGQDLGNWILLDAGDVVAHIFDDATRLYYDLENLWHGVKKEHHTDAPRATLRRAQGERKDASRSS